VSNNHKLVLYDPQWSNDFSDEREHIAKALGDFAVRIDHNGSTSVPGLAAKPVIDIQVSVHKLQPIKKYAKPLKEIGYIHVPHPDDSFSAFFHKPEEWPHKYHLHVVKSGGDEELKTLAFRDYLRDQPEVAKEYEELKRKLINKFEGEDFSSRQAYAEEKTEFITSVTEQALKEGYPIDLINRPNKAH